MKTPTVICTKCLTQLEFKGQDNLANGNVLLNLVCSCGENAQYIIYPDKKYDLFQKDSEGNTINYLKGELDEDAPHDLGN